MERINNDKNKKNAFDIDESALIQLKRRVEKLNIGYAKVPKKVNVKQLKVDMWNILSFLNKNEDTENTTNTNDVISADASYYPIIESDNVHNNTLEGWCLILYILNVYIFNL